MSVLGVINTKQTSRPTVVSAPVGGLNGKDSLADMAATDAYLLDNLFPSSDKISARRGCVKHTNVPLPGAVQSLEVYSGAASEIMLAWSGTRTYNVSTATPVEIDSGILNSYVITAMFSNAADNGQHLIIVNGANAPKSFNGTSIVNLTMTGITTPSDLNFVFTFKNRLYFGARNRLGFFYLPVGQIQGALSYFDLAQVSKKGGRLVAIATYSQNSGDSPDDYIIFITSRGECIVYAGTDPSSAANWRLIGRYYAATPIGQKCAFNLNGELIILTLEGAIPFSEIRKAGDSRAGGVTTNSFGAITTKLGKFISDLNVNANVLGWEGTQYSRGSWLLLNVPATPTITGDYYHFVMNVNTGSWCRFTNWNGLCFTVFNRRLYFGKNNGYVMLADEGKTDDGAPIEIEVKSAYNYFTTQNEIGNMTKHFQWAQLFLASDGTPTVNVSFSVNFNETRPDLTAGLPNPGGAQWDVAQWDVAQWAVDSQQRTALVTLNRGGFNGSLWLRASLNNISFEWFATQFVMERTVGLLP